MKDIVHKNIHKFDVFTFLLNKLFEF